MSANTFRDMEHPWIQHQSFADASIRELLDFSPPVDLDAQTGKAPAWVFDLDSTLFCTAPRNKRVLWRFLRERADFPGIWMRLWSELNPAVQRYGIAQTFYYVFRHLGLPHVEALSESKNLWKEFEKFWSEEFFLSRNIVFDTPYPGALEFVKEIYSRGYQVIYLTGRDVDRARAGSFEVLRQNGFPMGANTHLWLKPYRTQDDLEFKDRASAKLRAQFNVRALIDNEPENLVMFAKKFPEAEIVLFHSIMSMREPEGSYRDILNGRKAWKLLSFD